MQVLEGKAAIVDADPRARHRRRRDRRAPLRRTERGSS